MMVTPPTRRDPVLDASKGILILLVILGHLLARSDPQDGFVTKALITGIYAFHMPAFVFLAGITSKPRGILQRCTQFLTLLVVFQVAYFLARWVMGSDATFSWVRPYWILWFLLSMTVWTVLTPLIAKIPRTSLILSVLISLASGMIDVLDYPYSASRTLVFLPFFVLGFTYGKPILSYLSRLLVRGRAVVTVSALLTFGFLLYWAPDHKWFYGSRGYDVLDVSDPTGVIYRLVLQIYAVVLTAGLLVLVPRDPGLLVRFGQRSLSIFLLQGFAILAVARYAKIMAEDNRYEAVVIYVILMAGIALLASMQPVHQAIGRIGTLLLPLVEKVSPSSPVAGTGRAQPVYPGSDKEPLRAEQPHVLEGADDRHVGVAAQTRPGAR
ncbi:acyltransferase family protein [Arthrobacter rhombi]|uniref:acyltransferase family protein n=1 Tax=Arthrobacter rhombi TaxID=71253 RepID=UPI003FD11759